MHRRSMSRIRAKLDKIHLKKLERIQLRMVIINKLQLWIRIVLKMLSWRTHSFNKRNQTSQTVLLKTRPFCKIRLNLNQLPKRICRLMHWLRQSSPKRRKRRPQKQKMIKKLVLTTYKQSRKILQRSQVPEQVSNMRPNLKSAQWFWHRQSQKITIHEPSRETIVQLLWQQAVNSKGCQVWSNLSRTEKVVRKKKQFSKSLRNIERTQRWKFVQKSTQTTKSAIKIFWPLSGNCSSKLIVGYQSILIKNRQKTKVIQKISWINRVWN